MVTRLACSEVCWFICGQLGVVLVDHHSVVLATMTGQVRQCGGCHDLLPLAVGGLLYLGVGKVENTDPQSTDHPLDPFHGPPDGPPQFL